MSLLYYSVMGEGRGHAARARAVVERLRDRHRVVLFTSHDALSFLKKHYDADPEVDVREIPGLKFHYTPAGIDNLKTIRLGLAFWASMGRYTRRLDKVIESERPDLVITDFEPLAPRAARRAGVPILSLDHQHFLSTYDLSSLPRELRDWAWRMSWSIWAFGIRQERTVVSAFYKPPLRRGCEDIVQVGPLIRRAVAERQPTTGEHLLSYVRRATPQGVIDRLAGLPMPVRLYGLGVRPPQGSVTFCEINETTFVDDLASCDAVVAAAGNQLMGEALYFGKPVLALPERHHYEQRINATFVEQMGAGEQQILERLSSKDLANFLMRRETYREHLAATRPCQDGAAEAVGVIEAMLLKSDASVAGAATRETA
ncbi:MurG-like transferase [Botrimarina colliarenosi]|uniref:MurG-like transferase n=1 Tax=Botrimarina colliarenosi TaxID=2528001 RepID=A0A5C6AM79_9BACT|nr:glycosyltransferase family protein [Botrimarina colliarenosi]TWU00379.1 MurG-like transferase [Botrimarina colliarenosi]